MAFSHPSISSAPSLPLDPIQEASPTTPDLIYIPGFISGSDAQRYFESLKDELSFHSDQILINGNMISTKRLMDYRADSDAFYAYSGSLHAPNAWSPSLLELKSLVEQQAAIRFNACLCNYYEDGEIGMGWHADKERELGPKPVIASLSFGQTRTFAFRRRTPWRSKGSGYEKWTYTLNAGDLLIMKGLTQRYFEHSLLPTTKNKAQNARINLTFRTVMTPSGISG